jgi:hypothetical protein
MVELLLENGARMNAATWIRGSSCADVVDAGEVRVSLEQPHPQDASTWREGVSTRW